MAGDQGGAEGRWSGVAVSGGPLLVDRALGALQEVFPAACWV